MENENYIAYLLTTYDVLMDQYECNADKRPIKIVRTKEQAYDFILECQGGIAVWGITEKGQIYAVMVDDDNCRNYNRKNCIDDTDEEYAEFKQDMIEDIKIYLDIQ